MIALLPAVPQADRLAVHHVGETFSDGSPPPSPDLSRLGLQPSWLGSSGGGASSDWLAGSTAGSPTSPRRQLQRQSPWQQQDQRQQEGPSRQAPPMEPLPAASPSAEMPEASRIEILPAPGPHSRQQVRPWQWQPVQPAAVAAAAAAAPGPGPVVQQGGMSGGGTREQQGARGSTEAGVAATAPPGAAGSPPTSGASGLTRARGSSGTGSEVERTGGIVVRPRGLASILVPPSPGKISPLSASFEPSSSLPTPPAEQQPVPFFSFSASEAAEVLGKAGLTAEGWEPVRGLPSAGSATRASPAAPQAALPQLSSLSMAAPLGRARSVCSEAPPSPQPLRRQQTQPVPRLAWAAEGSGAPRLEAAVELAPAAPGAPAPAGHHVAVLKPWQAGALLLRRTMSLPVLSSAWGAPGLGDATGAGAAFPAALRSPGAALTPATSTFTSGVGPAAEVLGSGGDAWSSELVAEARVRLVAGESIGCRRPQMLVAGARVRLVAVQPIGC